MILTADSDVEWSFQAYVTMNLNNKFNWVKSLIKIFLTSLFFDLCLFLYYYKKHIAYDATQLYKRSNKGLAKQVYFANVVYMQVWFMKL